LRQAGPCRPRSSPPRRPAVSPLRTLIGLIESFRVSRVAKSGGSRQYFPTYGKNRRRIFRGP
jgi:hypothetical protein